MRRRGLVVLSALVMSQSPGVPGVLAAEPVSQAQHPLIVLERHRASVVQRIVNEWAADLPGLPPNRRISAEELGEALWSLRSDRLLAASLAGSFATIEALVGESRQEHAAALKAAAPSSKNLGDIGADLVYTPINPCRMADTRMAGGALSAGVSRTFNGFSANFSAQGGTATNCGMPNGVAVIAMNVYAVNPTNLGFIKVWAANGAESAVSTVNYQTGIVAIATGAIVPVDGTNNNRFTAKSPAQVDFIADAVGYFKAPAGVIGDITGVTAGTGLSGGGSSGGVTLGISAGGVGSTELASGSVSAAKIASGQVVKSLNALTDAVTLTAGSNVTITPAGSAITIAAAAGGLTLPFAGSASTPGSAVFAIANSSTNIAIQANAINQPAVYGVSVNSRGVFGDGGAYGVYGLSASNEGVRGQGGPRGVVGVGSSAGVFGASANIGVFGSSNGSTIPVADFETGVYGASTGYGVYGVGGLFGEGVHGTSGYYGVRGVGTYGVYGIGNTYGVYAQGGFGGTGAKYFVEPHPSDPTKEIRFVSLEGPESGTYFRGSARTVNGFATIDVPESFRLVTDVDNLTVVAMPRGALAMVAGVEVSLDRIVIQSSQDVDFDYVVNGVRKAFKDHEAISENTDFVPRSAADKNFTKGLPVESIRRMKASGILDEGGGIRMDTAERLGWSRGWAERERAVAQSRRVREE